MFGVLLYLTSHWKMPQPLPQINVEARSRDVSFLCLSGIGLVEHSQQTLTKIAASATREFEKIVTPSNCAVVTVSQKRFRPSVWLVENPNLDVGFDLRPKLGMCSWGLLCLTCDAAHFTWTAATCSDPLFCYVGCKQVRNVAYLWHHFLLGKFLHAFASCVFAVYNPWIVLASIYTVHSEKQETFWLHWTYSVCTIPWEEVFPPFSQADADHKQGHTTEIPLKQQDIRAKTHFSLLWVVITTFYVECFNFTSLSSLLTGWNGASLVHQFLCLLMCRAHFS